MQCDAILHKGLEPFNLVFSRGPRNNLLWTSMDNCISWWPTHWQFRGTQAYDSIALTSLPYRHLFYICRGFPKGDVMGTSISLTASSLSFPTPPGL